MSLAKNTLVVTLLALMTGCGSVGMVTGSTRLANGGGGGSGAPLTNGPAMNSPGNVERPIDRTQDVAARSTPRDPAVFRIENCTRCN
jgi:hypothetical protein